MPNSESDLSSFSLYLVRETAISRERLAYRDRDGNGDTERPCMHGRGHAWSCSWWSSYSGIDLVLVLALILILVVIVAVVVVAAGWGLTVGEMQMTRLLPHH